MRRYGALFLTLGALFVFSFLAEASAETCYYLDFDEDGDPWTLRTELPPGVTSGTVKIVFQVPAVPPLGEEFLYSVSEACCNDIYQMGHYGSAVQGETLTFDPAIVDWFLVSYPTCIYCCAWRIDGAFTPDAPLIPGQRLFIGQAVAHAICDEFPPPCHPPHDFTITFEAQGSGCSQSSAQMGFICPTAGVSDGERPTFWGNWGQIKSRYRN